MAPRLRNPPVFSMYSSRTMSAKNERPGVPASVVAATCLVTRSQPIVAPMAANNTSRTPILAIIDSFTMPRFVACAADLVDGFSDPGLSRHSQPDRRPAARPCARRPHQR